MSYPIGMFTIGVFDLPIAYFRRDVSLPFSTLTGREGNRGSLLGYLIVFSLT